MSENHYTELRAVYSGLIDQREQLKSGDFHRGEVKADTLLDAINDLEGLLNEWDDRDDRDGEPEEDPSAEVEVGDVVRMYEGTPDEQRWVITDMDEGVMHALTLDSKSKYVDKGETDIWSRESFNDVFDRVVIESQESEESQEVSA